jgi:hypothetical protein
MSRFGSLGRWAVTGLVALSLAGCGATAGGGAGRVAVYGAGPDPVLAQQAAAFNRTVFEGAAIGAAAGAVIGALASRNRGQGALVGGVVGGLIGLAAGAAVGNTQQQFASVEDRLDARIDNARSQIGILSSIVRTTDRIIAERRRELAITRSRAPGRGSVAGRIAADRAEVEGALSSAVRQRNALIQQIQSDGGHPSLPGVIAAYDGQMGRLAANARTLQSLEREAFR